MQYQLKKEYRTRILEDAELQGKITKACGRKNVVTVIRWAKANDQRLTMLSVVNAIIGHLELPKATSLIEQK